MFLRCKSRRKDGKVHRSWSLVENRRVRGGRVVQRQVLYLGEINDSQQAAWRRTIEVFAEGQARARQMALFPEGEAPAPSGLSVSDDELVQVRPGDLQLLRPRQWGGAGWPVICGTSWAWMTSGCRACRRAARGRAG